MQNFFKAIFYSPLYNALVFIIQHIPYADLGIAVIILTVVVKLIIFPLNLKSVKTQIKMKEFEPELAEIKEKYKDSKEDQAKQTMLFYEKNKINPFGGILPTLIQIPILISLYSIFLRSGLPKIDSTILYPFVHLPTVVNIHFLNLIDVSHKSIILAIIVAISQLVQVQLIMPPIKKPEEGKTPSLKDDFARSMSIQMKYVLPIFTAYIGYITSGAVCIYFITSNIFAIGQEIYVRKTLKSPKK